MQPRAAAPPRLIAHGTHDAVQANDVLDTEEDMVDLYLTSKILTSHRRQTHEHVEAELLLEMYARQLQKMLNECSMIAKKKRSMPERSRICQSMFVSWLSCA